MRFWIVFCSLFMTSIASADDRQKTYLSVDALATPVRAIELKGFRTVGEAATYLLERVGYTFVVMPPAPMDAPFISYLPIRPSAIVDEVKPLKDVLTSMVATKYLLYVDRVNQRASFGSVKEKDYVQVEALEKIFSGQYIVTDPRL